MRHALKTLLVGAMLVAVGFAPSSGLAQDQNQGQGQNQNQNQNRQGQNQGQAGGLIADASGAPEVYNSAAGASGERTIISNNPGNASNVNAAGANNTALTDSEREERRAARRAAREAEAAAAGGEAAPVAEEPMAAEPVAAEPAPAAAPEAAPAPAAAGAQQVVALPNTGVGTTDSAPVGPALALAALAAAGAFVTSRRPRPI
jgi:hypothetical protein